jgi:hypothetical protein
VSYDARRYVTASSLLRSPNLFTCTIDTYTAQATAGDINKAVTNHKVAYLFAYITTSKDNFAQNLESNSTSLLVFGNGDGGGGPLAKMLENVRLLILPRQRRSLIVDNVLTAPSPPWHREHVPRYSDCEDGSLCRRILRPSEDELRWGAQPTELVRNWH